MYSSIILLFLLLIGAPCASAEVFGERIKPFVSARSLYDSNIFRVKNREQLKSAIGDDRLSDFVTNLSAGVNLNYQLSKQEMEVLLKKELARYTHYKGLNSDMEEISAAFVLKAFDRFSARLSGGQASTSVPKESYLTNQADKQINKSGGILLNYAMPSGFLLQTEGKQENFKYSNKALNYREYTSRVYGATIFYSRATDRNYYIGYLRNDLDFTMPQPMAGIMVSNNNRGEYWRIGLNREFNGRTVISLNAGYMTRNYSDFSARNFHGITGQGALHYRLTEKLTLSADIERKLSEELVLNQTYGVLDVIGLTAAYRATEKTQAYVRGSAGEKSYEGSANLFVTTFPPRQDKLYEVKSGAGWTPINKLSLDLNYNHAIRKSNLDSYDYRAHMVEFLMTYRF